ncbi:D-serine ammonia-lyase [Azohydromonas caseinilytica]|uniref:Probable D-serine dehydratase n=1 Tax=Azohydromonas caseinilytica TaxID=2728836 RepID=A0A848FEU5_9BURK|nr:D-serine ammonia-lyase [Azohydromonas caseinilytica]NML17938.1 D-serine ammonia-lyase [Azohydromonas caseinilytica]
MPHLPPATSTAQNTSSDQPLFDLQALKRGEPVLWTASSSRHTAWSEAGAGISQLDVEATVARWRRFAPLLARLFPELQVRDGVIESELLPVPRLQRALGIPQDFGTLLVKADHGLPVAGSVKARGGIHEVLEHAEGLALRHGLLALDGDYRVLAEPAARALFARHQVAVGSTGNLGLAIGVMASALGFRAVVHMSADAKEWKKARLRARGVEVVEHAGDYAEAVAAGRRAALSDPACHFVDDERSRSLFLGYAAAAPHLARQLAALGRRVDAQHPLFVYLPCGVGGAPGGIAFGLAQLFGPHVHCFFAEPTRSPCFLLQMLAGTPGFEFLGDQPSVYDVGLDNRTEADGLAVPCASELAAEVAGPLLGGVYTVEDETLFRLLHAAAVSEELHIEPSAAAGFSGPAMLRDTAAGQAYLERHGLQAHMAAATHIAWTTGGLFVPQDEYARFLARGRDAAARP